MNTPQSDRDLAIDRLLRGSRSSGTAAAATDDCLDAEALAAWLDGALSADAAAAAEMHASTCGRCRAALATAIRALPVPAAREPWWRRRWFMAGLVPLTAGAAAIAIYVATPKDDVRPSAIPVQEKPQSAVAQPADSAARSEPAPAPRAPETRPGLDDRFGKLAPRDQQTPAPPKRDSDTEVRAGQRRDESMTSDRLAAAQPSAPPPASVNETVMLRREASSVQIASPDSAIQWRIGAAGLVQRSPDGTTWETISTGVSVDLTAVASPGPSVCWIVGRSGTVLLSTDGRAFRRIVFPERVDLAAVEAIDSNSATVTAVDGRRFRTSDGGRTWVPLP